MIEMVSLRVVMIGGVGTLLRPHGPDDTLDEFTVITADLRGHGDSDKPTKVETYGFERLTDDILTVADAARVTRFAVWGYSFGGNMRVTSRRAPTVLTSW